MKMSTSSHDIRARVVILSLISAAGLYLSISYHPIAVAVFALNLVSLLFLNDREVFWQMLFLLPFTTVYKYSTASTSLFTYLSLVAVCRLFVNNMRATKHFIVALLLFAIVSVIGIGSAMVSFIKLVSNVFLLWFFVRVVKRETFPQMVLAISLGEVVSSLIGLRKTTWPALASFFYSLKEEHIGGVKVARFTGLYLDPNYYSIIVIVCLYALLLFMYKKEISYKLGVPLFVALIVFGCMTYSRTFYIALVCVLVAIIAIRFRNGAFASTLAIGAVFFVAFAYYEGQSGVIESILSRFQREDISSGRFGIWKMYLDEIGNSLRILTIGAGLGASLPGNVGAHNFYIETVYHIGLLGAAIYFWLLYTILKRRPGAYFKRSLGNWALTGVLMFIFATLGMFFQFDFAYILMLNWIILNTDMRKTTTDVGEDYDFFEECNSSSACTSGTTEVPEEMHLWEEFDA